MRLEKILDRRFFVIADNWTEEREKQYTFYFEDKGTDEDIERLVQAFLKHVKKEHGTVEGWGARRLMVFFKVYAERQQHIHIKGILDFTNSYLKKELVDFKQSSFLKLWTDRYDDDGFPLLEHLGLDLKPVHELDLLNETTEAEGIWFKGLFKGKTRINRPYKFSAYAVSDKKVVEKLYRLTGTPMTKTMRTIAHKFGDIEDELGQPYDHGHMKVNSAAVLFVDTIVSRVVAVFFDFDIHTGDDSLLSTAFLEIIDFAIKEGETEFLVNARPVTGVRVMLKYFLPLRILSNIKKIVLTEYTKSKIIRPYQFGYQWFVHRNERLVERYGIEKFDITA